jgi:hypothetical protein
MARRLATIHKRATVGVLAALDVGVVRAATALNQQAVHVALAEELLAIDLAGEGLDIHRRQYRQGSGLILCIC